MQIAAFFGGNASHLPWLDKTLFPSYHNALKGVQYLTKNKLLSPDAKGFKEIAQVFKMKALKQNPKYLVEDAPNLVEN